MRGHPVVINVATVDEAAESEAENSCNELLVRGAEFLKRGKNVQDFKS
jgi:hypothetical protein